MYSHYLKRLTQVNYDDVMKYIATGHDNKDALRNKSIKDSESHVREFFHHIGFV